MQSERKSELKKKSLKWNVNVYLNLLKVLVLTYWQLSMQKQCGCRCDPAVFTHIQCPDSSCKHRENFVGRK